MKLMGDYRCKLCIAESSKKAFRMRTTLPRLVADVRKWPDRKVKSEIEWLEKRLEVLISEHVRRGL